VVLSLLKYSLAGCWNCLKNPIVAGEFLSLSLLPEGSCKITRVERRRGCTQPITTFWSLQNSWGGERSRY
jgi:hypothetical protein